MTAKGLLQTLQGRVQSGALTLDAALPGVSGWPHVLEALGIGQVALENVAVDPAAGTVRGSCTLLGRAKASAAFSFADADGGISAALQADLAGATIGVPGATTFGLRGAGISLLAPGDGGPLVGDVHATLSAGALEVPISIPLPAPENGWVIRGSFGRKPLGLEALTDLLGVKDLAAGLPAALGDAARGLALTGLEVRCNTASKMIERISATVASETAWPIVPGHVVLQQPSVCFSLIGPGSENALAVMVSGTVQAGDAVVPITVIRDAGAIWRFTIPTAFLPLPGPSTLAALVSDAKWLTGPDGFDGSGGIGLTTFDLAFDAAAREVRSLHIAFGTDDEWTLPFVDSISVGNTTLDVAADYVGGGGVAATIAGTLSLGGLKLELSGSRSGTDSAWEVLQATLDKASVPLSTLVGQFLPDVTVPDLEVDSLGVRIEPVAERYTLSAGVRGPWTVPVGVAELSIDGLTLEIGAARQQGATKAIGSLHGAATFAGASFKLDYPLGGQLRIQSVIPKLSLSGLLTAAGVERPAFLPEIELKDVSLDVTPRTGEFALDAKLAKRFDIPVGGGALRVESLTVHVERGAAGVGCRIALVIGPFAAGDQFQLERFTLTFTAQGGGGWSASGAVSGSVLHAGFDFAAGYQERGASSVFELATKVASPTDLFSLAGVGSMSVNGFALRVETTTKNGAATRRWSAAAAGRARLALGEAGFDATGKIVLETGDGSASLVFLPDKAHASIPLDPLHPQPRVAMELDFQRLGISRSKEGWGFDAAVDLAFRGLPPGLQAYLPAGAAIKTTFRAGPKSVTLTADPALPPVEFAIPEITRAGITLDLGSVRIFARHLTVTLGKEVTLGAELHLGLPAALDYLFGAKKDGSPTAKVFRTYDPAHPEPGLFAVRLAVGTDGVSFQVLSSPFTFLSVEGGRADVSVEDFCALGFQLPTLRFDPATQTFAADVAVDIKSLALPLAPLIAVLRAFKLDAAADVMPRSLPFQPIELVDGKGHLRVPELIGLLQRTGGGKLPKAFTDALEALAEVVDRLPAALKRYLRIGWPDEFRLKLATTATGSVRLDFAVGEKSEPLRFLFPVMSGPFPQLIGVELYGVAFGEVFGGALLLVEIDARIDRFNLPTIVGSLALPEEGVPAIPASSSTLQDRLILDKLFAVVFYQAGVPIPIPLFYDELGVEYWGIEGLRYEGHIRLPMPRFNLMEVVRQIGVFKRFFTEEDSYIDEKAAPEDMNLKFSTGLNYIQLPQYLGAGMLGDKQPGPSINAYKEIAKLLNALKGALLELRALTINDLIQLIPLDDRVLAGDVAVAQLSADGAFALTTPKEFSETAYQRLEVPAEEIKDALTILPAPGGRAPDETGLCLYFRGGFAIGKAVSFEAMYALAAMESRFGTGFGVHGALANGTVDAALRGQFTIDPSQPVPVGLAGSGHLTVAGQPILDGEVSLGNNGFHLRGLLDLVPRNPNVQIKGTIEGEVGPDATGLVGDLEFTVGRHFTLVGASVLLDATTFSVTGTVFDQSLTLAAEKFERKVGRKLVSGLRFSGELSPIAIGDLFRLSGGGPRGGPHAALEVGFGPAFGLELSGAASLLDIVGAATAVRLSERGFEFTISGKLLKVFASTVHVAAGSLTNGDAFQLDVEFAAEAIADIATAALRDLAAAAADASRELSAAQKSVADAQRDVDAAIADAQGEVRKAQAAVSSLRAKIRRVDKQIASVKKQMRRYRRNPFKLADLGARLAKLGSRRTALEGQLRTAQLGLEVAKAVLQFARTGARIVGLVVRGTLSAIKKRADAARKTLAAAQKRLAQLEKQLGVAAQLAGYKGTPLQIQSVGFHAALNRVKGAAVGLEFGVKFLGKKTTYSVQAQLITPEQVAHELVQTLLGK